MVGIIYSHAYTLLLPRQIAIPFSLIKDVKKMSGHKHDTLGLITDQRVFEFQHFEDFEQVHELITRGWKKRTGHK